MTDPDLAQALLEAVRSQHLGLTPDRHLHGQPVRAFPSVDLAVAGFPERGPVRAAHVLFSRQHPQGWVAPLAADGQAVRALRYLADQTDARQVSHLWLPQADWTQHVFTEIPGQPAAPPGPVQTFVLPYPASLLKVMVAIGVGLALDAGLTRLQEVDTIARSMIVDSDNEATTVLVRRLHDWGLIVRGPQGETHNALHQLFAARDLHVLKLGNTTREGGWGNAAGSGVGHIHMGAWDTVRLLWLLDPHARPAPWPGAAPLLSETSRDHLLRWMGEHSPNRILLRDETGSGVHFIHKVGTTENYGSDAGIVRARPPGRRHYLVALVSNLGSRYGPPGAEFDVSPRLSSLGLAIDALMRERLGD